jgi:hypothetical protein
MAATITPVVGVMPWFLVTTDIDETMDLEFDAKLRIWEGRATHEASASHVTHAHATAAAATVECSGTAGQRGREPLGASDVPALREKLAAAGYARSWVPYAVRVAKMKLREEGWFWDHRRGFPLRVMPALYAQVSADATIAAAGSVLLDDAICSAVALAEMRAAAAAAARAREAEQAAAAKMAAAAAALAAADLVLGPAVQASDGQWPEGNAANAGNSNDDAGTPAAGQEMGKLVASSADA